MSMLQVYDQNHDLLGWISSGTDYKDLHVTSQTASGDRTLELVLLADARVGVDCEYYIRSERQEYVVKSTAEISGGGKTITAQLNLEDLQGTTWQNFNLSDTTVRAAATAALTGTGWSVDDYSTTKTRNVTSSLKTALGVLDDIRSAFLVEMYFDTITKTVYVYDQRGAYRGAYFMTGLNLKKLSRKTTSYDFATVIEPYGADGLDIASVNNGSKRLSNHNWSQKRVCLVYQDTNYTSAQALKDDMTLYLADLAKLRRSYAVEILDLAKLSEKYDILEYELGDTIELIDKNTRTRERQRIVKLAEYPDDPERNTCEISNTVLTWEELQARAQKTQKLVEQTITTDGKISVGNILQFERGEVVTDGDIMALSAYVTKTDARLAALEGG